MAGYDTPFDEFLALAAPNLNRGCEAVFACIYTSVNSVWTNLASTVLLAPKGDELEGHFAPRLFDIEDVRALRVIVTADKVPALLRGIVAGTVPLECLPAGCDEIHFVGRLNGNAHNFAGSSGDIRNLAEYGIDLRGHVLQASGSSNAELIRYERWRDVSSRLSASSPPFRSLTAVGVELRIRKRLEHNDSTGVALVSPYWLALSCADVRHEDASISVGVTSRWSELETAATLSLLPSEDYSDHKQLIVVGDSSWQSGKDPESNWTTFRRTIAIGESIGPAALSLNFAGRQIQTAAVGVANARVVAHELIDPELRNLKSRLFERKGGSDDARQEEGVAWLLHLCGLSVARYGFKDMQRATDVLAFLGNDAAIYAECTLELPPKEKLKNLESRAEALRSRLEQHYDTTITLVRAVFVPQMRSALGPSDADDAHEHSRTIFICREDQEQLLEMARRGESAERCFLYIAQRGREYAPAAL